MNAPLLVDKVPSAGRCRDAAKVADVADLRWPVASAGAKHEQDGRQGPHATRIPRVVARSLNELDGRLRGAEYMEAPRQRGACAVCGLLPGKVTVRSNQ